MDKRLFSLLLAGGTFPIGGFSQSRGLETYVSRNDVKSEADLRDFLEMYIHNVIGKYEGPYFCAAYEAAQENMQKLVELDDEFTAMKLTKESREASHRMGKSFLRLAVNLFEYDIVNAYYRQNKDKGINYPIAYALVSSKLMIDKEEALKAFVFSETNSIVQSGLKLIPLGNTQAQRILLDSFEIIEKAVRTAQVISIEEAGVFCPGLDIASICHETLSTRLYMS